MKYVYSTLSNDMEYVLYSDNKVNDLHQKTKSIIINGGANVAHKKTLVTPKGVVTEISDEDAELLSQNPTFKRQAKNGFVTIESSKGDPDKVAKDLTEKDGAAQLTPDDYADEEKPKSNKSKK